MRRGCGAAVTLGVMLTLAGCRRSSSPGQEPARAPVSLPDRHAHLALHGGTLVELGESTAHIELVFDREAATLTAFVLNGDADAPLRLRQPTLPIVLDSPPDLARRPLELRAVDPEPISGESPGGASEFVWRDPRLRELPAVSGEVLEIEIGGQTYREIRFPPAVSR